MNANEKETRLKRLMYRSWHRGCKETDIVLGNFAERFLSAMPAEELDVWELLLEENDVDIWDWLTEKSPPARAEYAGLLERLRETRFA